jgi:hypothetical protein
VQVADLELEVVALEPDQRVQSRCSRTKRTSGRAGRRTVCGSVLCTGPGRRLLQLESCYVHLTQASTGPPLNCQYVFCRGRALHWHELWWLEARLWVWAVEEEALHSLALHALERL